MDFKKRFEDLKKVYLEICEKERQGMETDEDFLEVLPEKESLAEEVVSLAKAYVDELMDHSGKDLQITLYPAYVLDSFEDSKVSKEFLGYLKDIIRYEEIMEGSFYERIPRMR